MYKKILTGSLLLTGMVFAQTELRAQETTDHPGIGYTLRPGEPGSPSVEYIDITWGGKAYKIVRSGDKIKELYVDGQRIPEEGIAKYRTALKQIDEQIRHDRATAAEDKERAEKDREMTLQDRKQIEERREQAEKDVLLAEQGSILAEKDKLMAEQSRLQADRDRELSEMDRERANLGLQQAKQKKELIELERKAADENREIAEKDNKFYELQLRTLVADLVKDHIISSKSELAGMGLSDQEMTVNGRRLSPEIHERYKKKYLRQKGMGLYYGKVELGNGVYFEEKDLKDL